MALSYVKSQTSVVRYRAEEPTTGADLEGHLSDWIVE